ncbi:MAG: (d)CMP kinase, partial [Christensenellales bacterium]
MVTNIAIDGTSGSGKSSVASKLADILNYYHLNTGQLYRAYALKCMQM